MVRWDLLLTNARIATMREDGPHYGAIEDGALAITDGRIAWIGPASTLAPGEAARTQSLDGRWITPALIDCHTHIVFGGDRGGEFEARLLGTSYESIADAGGGIMSTVRATRAARRRRALSGRDGAAASPGGPTGRRRSRSSRATASTWTRKCGCWRWRDDSAGTRV